MTVALCHFLLHVGLPLHWTSARTAWRSVRIRGCARQQTVFPGWTNTYAPQLLRDLSQHRMPVHLCNPAYRLSEDGWLMIKFDWGYCT